MFCATVSSLSPSLFKSQSKRTIVREWKRERDGVSIKGREMEYLWEKMLMSEVDDYLWTKEREREREKKNVYFFREKKLDEWDLEQSVLKTEKEIHI